MDCNETSSQYILHSVDNALQILDLFCSESVLTVSQISKMLKINRTSVFRTTATLEQRGYLTKRENGGYVLGTKLLALGSVVPLRGELVRLFHPYLHFLVSTLQESAQLVIWANQYQVLLMDKMVPNSTIQADAYMGRPRYAHLSSTGLVLLAKKTDEELEDYIQHVPFCAVTEYSIASPEVLRQKIAEVRRLNYCINDQMNELGWMSIAVPVYDQKNAPLAAISVAALRSRLVDRKEEVISLLWEVARDVHNAL